MYQNIQPKIIKNLTSSKSAQVFQNNFNKTHTSVIYLRFSKNFR